MVQGKDGIKGSLKLKKFRTLSSVNIAEYFTSKLN